VTHTIAQASKQARKASSEHLRSAGRPKSWNYQIQSNLVVSWQEQRRSESNYLKWVLVLVLWGTPSPPFHSANPSIEVGLPAPCRRNVCSQIRDSRTAFQKCSSENRRFTKTGSEQTQGRSNRTQRWVTHRNRSQSKAEQWRSVLDRHPSRTHRTQTAAHRPLPSKPGSLFRSFAVSFALLVTDHSSEVSSR
jgi:hypothetical protein